MGKKATYEIGAINITTHPHTAKRYTELFHLASDEHDPVKLYGDIHGVINSAFNLVENQPLKGIQGELVKYTVLNLGDPWYDINKGKQASKDQLGELRIPEGLAPNMKSTRYFFEPTHHRFIWVLAAPGIFFPPLQVLKLLTGVFSTPAVVRAFGKPELTIEQDRNKLDEILGIHRLERLDIEYSRPNPDDDDDDASEQAVEAQLERQRIKRVMVQYSADESGGIKPDSATKALSRLAVSNGFVHGRGYDAEGKRQDEDTADHPWKAVYRKSSDKMRLAEWLPTIVSTVIQKLTQ